MGKRGPKPKPTKTRILEGNPGHLKIAPEVDPPARASYAPPEFLNGDARAKWLDLEPTLSAVRLLTDLDQDALAQYCIEWSKWLWSVRETSTPEKCIDFTPNGMAQQSAWLLVQKNALAAMRKIGDSFGMSPAARVGLVVDTTHESDELDQYRKSG